MGSTGEHSAGTDSAGQDSAGRDSAGRDSAVGIGLIGTGIMGRRMLAALQQPAARAQWQVAGLWDPDPAALQAAQVLAPQARAAASLQALLGDPDVRLVYIAAPPAAHGAAVQATLAAGRACLCEKPLASSVAEAAALQALVAQAGLPFAVNFPFATSSSARRFAEIVCSGALGSVQQARISLRFAHWPRAWQAGAAAWLDGADEGGFTREVLSHFVFLALRCFGPARLAEVRLARVPGRAETALQARLEHAGVSLVIDAAVAGAVADDNRFEVVGSRDSAALAGWSTLHHEGQASSATDGTARLLQALADVMRQPAPALPEVAAHGLATVDEAADVVRIIEALLQPAVTA